MNENTTKNDWQTVIGLEVHAQLSSKAKLFSAASADFGAEPNSHVSLVDVAFPGMLPVINRDCVDKAVITGLALGAKINLYSVFDRKNYFYPDLPQGYQISQFYHPIVGEALVKVYNEDGSYYEVGIERIHLEQDAGKNIHDISADYSFVDLNRCGVALMEIVTKPDLRSSEQARSFVAKLRTIMRYAGTCDGNMEQGSLRVDVNVSVRRKGQPLGTRCEIKNVNSLRFIVQAIDYESERQIEVLSNGGKIIQQTRLFDVASGKTRPMRSKEEAHDYRYFPDPDLLPLRLSADYVEKLKKEIPELPDQKYHRLKKDYNINHYEASILVEEPAAAQFFESLAKISQSPLAINWVLVELFGALNKKGQNIKHTLITPANLAELLSLIASGTISGRTAKEVFATMFETGKKAKKIVKELGLEQISDTKELEQIIDDVIRDNPQNVTLLASKPKLRGWFVGQIMAKTAGRANPAIVNQLLSKKLPPS